MEDKKLTYPYLEKGSEAYKQSMEEYRQELLKDGWKEDQREFKSLMALHDHLISTSDEELQKEWAEVDAVNIEGPTVEEYFESLNPNAMYAKGYREGAKRYKTLVEEFLNGIVAQIKERKHNEAKAKYEVMRKEQGVEEGKFLFISPGISPIEDIIEQQILPQMQEIFDNN